MSYPISHHARKKEEPWKHSFIVGAAGKTPTGRMLRPPGAVAPIVEKRLARSPGGWMPWRRCGYGWNWSWLGGRYRAVRSPGALLAALAGAGCTGLSLGVSWFLPELAILSAVAAGFWWQVVRVVEGI